MGRGGGRKKNIAAAAAQTVSAETLAPRVARRLTQRHFQKAYIVGGETARRVIHDENPVTKDKSRTSFPPKGERFIFHIC